MPGLSSRDTHLYTVRAVKSLHLQILRFDGGGMINDVIMHTSHDVICEKKRVKKMVGIVIFDLILAYFAPITLLLILKWHTRVCEETFDVNSKIAQLSYILLNVELNYIFKNPKVVN